MTLAPIRGAPFDAFIPESLPRTEPRSDFSSRNIGPWQ